MTVFEIQEEIDILSYVVNSINTNILNLETISFKNGRYNLYMAQLTEICINIESKIKDLEELLDNFSIEELQDGAIERLKKDSYYDSLEEL